MVLNAGILQNLTFYTQRKYALNQMKNLVVQQTRVKYLCGNSDIHFQILSVTVGMASTFWW